MFAASGEVPERGSFADKLMREFFQRKRNLRSREYRTMMNIAHDILFMLHQLAIPLTEKTKEVRTALDSRMLSRLFNLNRDLDAELFQDTYRAEYQRFIAEEARREARENERQRRESEDLRRKVESYSDK